MNPRRKKLTAILATILFSLALANFIKIHTKLQATLLGYEIGRLKHQEALYLKKRSLLTMELAKLTTKTSLSELIRKP